MKKLFSMFLVVIMITLLSAPILAEAATIKLNKTKLTLDEGATYTLKLTGTTKTVIWSSSSKAIANVSNKGKVTAIRAGTATITAKVSSKKYTCKVTVKDVLTDTEAAHNIIYETHKTDKGLVIIATNGNKANIEIKVNVTYYDASDNMLSTEDGYVWTFQAGKKAVMTFDLPHDSNYNDVDYDRIDVIIKADVDSFMTNKSRIDDIQIESNIGSDGLMARLTNTSDDEISSISVTALYYVNGEVIGFSNDSFYSLGSGDVKTIEFYNPYDKNYNDIAYDDYEIIINEAYSY